MIGMIIIYKCGCSKVVSAEFEMSRNIIYTYNKIINGTLSLE